MLCRRVRPRLAASFATRGSAKPAPEFAYEPLFQLGAHPDPVQWRKLDLPVYTLPAHAPYRADAGSSARREHQQPLYDARSSRAVVPEGLVVVEGQVLAELTREAVNAIQHLYRPAHLAQLRHILEDPEASSNDRFVALQLLENACVSAGKVLPSCQDTGTATVLAKRGGRVLTDGNDEEHISRGVHAAYTEGYLRYSQVAPLSMFEEANTKTNLPAQIDVMGQPGAEYDLLFVAKGGGSANKTQLRQQTKATLNEKAFAAFVEEQVVALGTAACPPYHLALVVGGLSAEQNLKTVKLASCKYLDSLPRSGSSGGRAFRDVEWEERIKQMCQGLGIGAQYGGKYFVHDVRVVRLPRHGASCPVGIGVSCSADRQAKAKINADGVFLEQLEENPAKYLPNVEAPHLKNSEIVKVDLNQPMDETCRLLSRYPVATRLALTGTIVVARDLAHARINEMLAGPGMPEYLQQYPVYYAGPAKTPAGMASGSFGPTTAGRMDSYVDTFQQHRGSMVMIGKGNRSRQVTQACKKHGGFYLGSIGGVAATISSAIKHVQVLDMEELGMEAVWRIEVEDFPAFIVVDDKGNDFFQKWMPDGVTEPEEDSSFDEVHDFFFGLDANRDGVLDVQELCRGLDLSEREVKELMAHYDTDGSGDISMQEFELMVFQHQELLRRRK